MKLEVYKIDGSKSGETVELSDNIFAIEPNDHVIYLAVKAHLGIKDRVLTKLKNVTKFQAVGKNLGDKKVEVLQEQVQPDLLYGLEVEQFLDRAQEIIVRN